jgi:antitoxin HicB
MSLPYTIELQPEIPSGWYAGIKELPGCMTTTDTAEEALAEIQHVKEEWIRTALEDKFEIPEPHKERKFSGSFRLRVPKNLHGKLVRIAEEEGVSLNTICNNFLSEAVGESIERKTIPILINNRVEWEKALKLVCEFADVNADELELANLIRDKAQTGFHYKQK